MKRLIHSIVSLLMAFVVLLSTLSFTINMHYCGDTLVETSVMRKAKGCGMEMEKATTKTCSAIKKNCCDNKQLTVEGQDELQLTFNKLSLDQTYFIVSLTQYYFNLFEEQRSDAIIKEVYKPPIVTRHIFKLDESYLI